jgi:ribosome-binding protein aMBF1 (putative translation factor)
MNELTKAVKDARKWFPARSEERRQILQGKKAVIGILVEEARMNEGWTLKEFSGRVGISSSSLWRIEAGEQLPTLEVARKINAALSRHFKIQKKGTR